MIGLDAITDRIGGLNVTRSMETTSRLSQGDEPAPTGGADFKSFLGSMASDVVGALRTGESTAIAGIQGKAGVQQVVETVMQAEQHLQVALAVRDKVVSAYLEISRMPI
jgi:flagellar hook-basal body complex protein FliE